MIIWLSSFIERNKLHSALYIYLRISMPRPKPRIDILKRLGKPIAFSVDDRANIEAKYGHELTSELWKQITDVTSVLTIFTPGITDATRLPVVLSKLKKLEAAAKSLRSEFNEVPDRGNFTPEEIYWAFFAPRRRSTRPGEEFLFLDQILGALIKFSEFAIQEIQKTDPKQPNTWRSMSEGEAWNVWVNALTKIMDKNGLPYKVRMDTDKKAEDVHSPFVRLIRELQKCLPKECRRFTHSDDALAKGIHRARHR
jgi:hypothetical protein